MKTWIKTLGIISIALIILDIILMIIVGSTGDGLGAGLMIGLILLPFLGIIIGIWLISFLLVYLIKKNKALAKILSIIGLVFFGIVFLISILGLFRIMPFENWDIGGWFAWPFQVIIVIFFIVSTIVTNRK